MLSDAEIRDAHARLRAAVTGHPPIEGDGWRALAERAGLASMRRRLAVLADAVARLDEGGGLSVAERSALR